MEKLSLVDVSLLSISPEQMASLIPYFWMIAGALVATVLSAFKKDSIKTSVFFVSVVTLCISLFSSLSVVGSPYLTLFGGMMISDSFTHTFNIIFIFSALATILFSYPYLKKEGLQYSEFYTLVLFSALGMMLMVSSRDLISVFIALELMSLTTYVLVGFRRADRRSNEAAIKYFILGSAASAVFLYGSALMYGATGSTSLNEILDFVQSHPGSLGMVFILGALLALVGFLFKVAAVPFHMWTPDVYEGAPTPITGFMSTGIKAAAFAMLIRILGGVGFEKVISPLLTERLRDILWVIAIGSMIFGNVIALTQTNLKRLFAYSSIAHAGYLLVGLLSAPQSNLAYAPLVLYLIVYIAMMLGIFGILTMVSGRGDTELNYHDLSGFSRRHPWLAFSMAVFMFSMAGIPPTAGFVSKYYIFYSAVQAGEIWLVVVGVLCSAVSIYYYFKVMVYMYMRSEPEGKAPSNHWIPAYGVVVLAMTVALVLQVGILPSRLLTLSKWVTQII